MTQTRDIATEIYVAIANGLAVDPNWPIAPNNFIRYDNVKGLQDPEKIVTSDGDFPQATLEGPVSGDTNLQTGTETFGTHAGDCDFLETGNFVYTLEIVSDYLRIRSYSPQTMEAINAIRRLGAKLGLDFVTQIKAKWTEKKGDVEDGARRIYTTITLTVRTDTNGNALTGD